MCGRFYLIAKAAEIRRQFHLDEVFEIVPHYSIAPAQPSPIIITEGRGRRLVMARWGLVPSWARDLSLGSQMINAPAEEIDEKSAFRTPFSKQRCLVPASGFYEWQARASRKQPYRIAPRSGTLFAFAGLWDRWAPETGGPVDSFTIITTRANKLMSEVHPRMPVILAATDYQRWLTGSEAAAKKLLVPYTGGMSIVAVSDRVNNIKEDDVGLIAPL
jgi:putative SOS response-associated peptidase YedK